MSSFIHILNFQATQRQYSSHNTSTMNHCANTNQQYWASVQLAVRVEHNGRSRRTFHGTKQVYLTYLALPSFCRSSSPFLPLSFPSCDFSPPIWKLEPPLAPTSPAISLTWVRGAHPSTCNNGSCKFSKSSRQINDYWNCWSYGKASATFSPS